MVIEHDDDALKCVDSTGRWNNNIPYTLLSICSAVITNYRLMLEGRMSDISAENMESWLETNYRNWEV